MKKKIFIIIKYLFIFLFFLFWNLIISKFTTEEVWNYGFSYNISKGLIPYKDFNMVLTPLFSYIFSIGLNIYSDILTFQIENSILLCFMFYLIEKLIPKYKYLIIFLLIFPLSVIFPSYNLFLLFLFILIIYLEKNYSNKDYLIGIIISFIILTKQTVGIFFIIPSIILYYKDFNKIFKRFIGLLIPIFIFIIYLLFNNNLYNFINYCFLGLLSFGNKNSSLSIYLVISLIMFIINIILYIKSRNTKYLYLLCFYSINIPIFDLYHFIIYLVSYIFILLIDYKNRFNFNYNLFFIGLIIGISIINICNIKFDYKYPNNINNFRYRYFNKDYIKYTESVSKIFNEYKDKDIIFLSGVGYYFKLVNNKTIGYYDLINYGNYGYNGDELLVKDIKSNHSKYIFIYDSNYLDNNSQINKELVNYVLDNGTCIKNINYYDIYIVE